jgi:hypothetical protein
VETFLIKRHANKILVFSTITWKKERKRKKKRKKERTKERKKERKKKRLKKRIECFFNNMKMTLVTNSLSDIMI